MNNITEKIFDMINNSGYYSGKDIKESYFDNLEVDTPLLTKDDLRKNRSWILNKEMQNMKTNLLKVIRTSGSTGKSIEVFWDNNDYIKSNIQLWRMRKTMYNITPKSKKATFHSVLYNESNPIEADRIMFFASGREVSFSKFYLENEDIDEYFELMQKHSIEWIATQPSVAYKLAKYLQINNKKKISSLRYIELTGERVSPFLKKMLKQVFNVPIADLYGCSEVNAIALECPFGNKHVLEQNVLLQLYRPECESDGVSGEIIISSLHNQKFPIIGYQLGDRVKICNNKICKCGCSGTIIKSIQGRVTDDIILKNGYRFNSFLLTFCVERVNYLLGNPIEQFQMRFSDGSILLVLNINKDYKNWEDVIKEEIYKIVNSTFSGKLDNLQLKLVYEEISISKTGKYKNYIMEEK